ncbi:MAG: tryptophanase [Defluviitaleaceae bacterium]|nr:tryptophanase [Defluviitaleaceae bacterium]MCL2273935.1 tryptophanase [Defluviitaleaceae bacterium]
MKYIPEPFRIKMVEKIKMLTREEREQRIKAADYNLFGLHAQDVYIDLLTDSGTGAMSSDQWSGVMLGDEAYAGSKSYHNLIKAGKDIFGYDYIQPVHQGRAAEKVLFPLFLSKGKYAISNTFFDTTRAHVELAGARAIDCVSEEAKKPAVRAPFKGNMDIEKLEKTINELGAENVGLIVLTITNNSAGGQPVSMENIKATADICKKYNIVMEIDAARFAENAFFIKRDEAGYAHKPLPVIIREMFSYGDIFHMSSKKDAIVNIGGILGVKDGANPIIAGIKANCISYEGFYTYGGLSGRDMEALAIGLYEGIDEDFLRYRIGQCEYLAAQLDEAGIAYQSPVGGHGLFIDAAAMYPQIPHHEFPAQVLAIELYKEAGIRTCDIGSYMLGNDPDTGVQLKSDFEFTRFAIPRRVYTQAHFDIMAEALIAIKSRAHEQKRGLKILWEPPILRHFQAKLEWI